MSKMRTSLKGKYNPSVSIADPANLPNVSFPTRRAWKVKVSFPLLFFCCNSSTKNHQGKSVSVRLL